MARQLGGDVLGSRRMAAQVAQHGLPLVDAVLGVGLAEDGLRAGFMGVLVEGELAGRAAAGIAAEGPAGDHLGEGGHVRLGIARAHAHGVQFHDLARQVLVQPALAIAVGRRVRADRLRIVEIFQHARMRLDGVDQVVELAEGMRPDGLAFIGAGGDLAQLALARRKGEVVHPEHRHALVEADRRPLDRAIEAGVDLGLVGIAHRVEVGLGAHRRRRRCAGHVGGAHLVLHVLRHLRRQAGVLAAHLAGHLSRGGGRRRRRGMGLAHHLDLELIGGQVVEQVGRGLEIGGLQHRRAGGDLGHQGFTGIRAGGDDAVRTRAETEARQGQSHIEVGRLRHAFLAV